MDIIRLLIENWFAGLIVACLSLFVLLMFWTVVDTLCTTYRSHKMSRYISSFNEMYRSKAIAAKELQKTLSVMNEIIDKLGDGSENTKVAAAALRILLFDNDAQQPESYENDVEWLKTAYEKADESDDDTGKQRNDKRSSH